MLLLEHGSFVLRQRHALLQLVACILLFLGRGHSLSQLSPHQPGGASTSEGGEQHAGAIANNQCTATRAHLLPQLLGLSLHCRCTLLSVRRCGLSGCALLLRLHQTAQHPKSGVATVSGNPPANRAA